MNDLAVVVDSSSNLDAIRAQLRDVFELHFSALDQIKDIKPNRNVVFDINLPACSEIQTIKEWLAKRPTLAKVVFAVDRASWHAQAQAAAFGASCILDRPLSGKSLMTVLLGDFDSLADNKSPPFLRSLPTVAPTLDALENIFLSAHFGAALDLKVIDFAGRMLIRSIAETGIASWVDAVRTHHSQTYQHSLLVTGIIVAFAQKLRMTEKDQLRLSFAAMVHDIGKARIPVSILEKSTELDKDEMKVMRKHPEYGFEALGSVVGIDQAILDTVIHHHEYLDGTGYPHGLKATQISDLVRIVTISDIFGALIERRAYKNAMSCKSAYDILLNMGPRLDADMRREFQFVSKLHVN
jgi:putative nucleotidyltransferase with HDIG domain